MKRNRCIAACENVRPKPPPPPNELIELDTKREQIRLALAGTQVAIGHLMRLAQAGGFLYTDDHVIRLKRTETWLIGRLMRTEKRMLVVSKREDRRP